MEIASALARRTRERVISAGDRDRGLQKLAEDFRTFWVVEVNPEVIDVAKKLVTRHPLRAADAVQLASCLYARREVSEEVALVTFDERLAQAAAAEHIPVIPSVQ